LILAALAFIITVLRPNTATTRSLARGNHPVPSKWQATHKEREPECNGPTQAEGVGPPTGWEADSNEGMKLSVSLPDMDVDSSARTYRSRARRRAPQ
jgi:hypothetical protein